LAAALGVRYTVSAAGAIEYARMIARVAKPPRLRYCSNREEQLSL